MNPPDNCSLCDRCTVRSQVVASADEFRDYKYLIVFDAPTKEDDNRGVFNSGNQGSVVRGLLKEAGIPLDEVRFQGATRCYTGKAPVVKEIRTCRQFLLAQFEQTGVPPIIITMGSGALTSIMGTTKGVIAMRGSVHEARMAGNVEEGEGLDVVVVPTFAPGILYREPQKREVIVADLRKAKTALDGHDEPIWTDTFIAKTLDDVKMIRDELLSAEYFSFDIETTGLNPWAEDSPTHVAARVLCVSFSKEPGKAYVIPLFGQYCHDVWANEEELHEVYSLLAEILESDVFKIAANGKFDSLYLRVVLGIYPRNFNFDSQLGYATIHEERPHNLEHTRTMFTQMARYEGFKDDKDKYPKEATDYWGYAAYEDSDLQPYAGADADAELRVALQVLPLIEQESVGAGGPFAA